MLAIPKKHDRAPHVRRPQECCNFRDGECIMIDKECYIKAGHGCTWYDKISKSVKVRRCSCGEALGHRERMCSKCRKLARKETAKNYYKNKKTALPL